MSVALRIYAGEAAEPLPPIERKRLWTLRQAFKEVTLPLLVRRCRASGSIEKYERALWYWEQSSTDPPISSITPATLDDFVAALPTEHPQLRQRQSANQQLMYVEAILRSCGPRVGRRGGAGILDDVPCGERLPEQPPSRRRRRIPDDVLCRLYEAAAEMRPPRAHRLRTRIPPCDLWRGFLVTGVNVGPRRCELWRLPESADFRRTDCPDEAIEATSPHGWLFFETPKVQHRKLRNLCVPVAPAVRAHLDRLRDLWPRRSMMFPAVSVHPSTWRNWFNRLQDIAGITDHYTFQDLRKTCSMRYRKHAGRDVAEFMLGHSPRGVNARWYDELADDAIAAVLTLPQPEAFTRSL